MMKGLILSSLLTFPLLSGELISQNIYEKEDSIDIMFSFDVPYEGTITQKKEENQRILILDDITIPKQITKDINSSIIQTLQLVHFEKKLFITLTGHDAFIVDASKTIDNYGLRLRIKPLETLSELAPIKEATFETKKEDDLGSSYIKMFMVLALLIGFLYLLKNWLLSRGENMQHSWLFANSTQKNKNALKIVQQRALDVKTKVALVSYADKEYLVLLGSSNLLLDTFDTHAENDFDKVLSKNEETLNDFIKHKKFDDYKQKVSTEI